MNVHPHGKMTSILGKALSEHYSLKGYDVLYDHGIKSENVGKIVSWFGGQYNRESELGQLDVAVLEKDSNKVIALIEIEETNDRPKTLLGDIFGVFHFYSIF